jgi:dGTPase
MDWLKLLSNRRYGQQPKEGYPGVSARTGFQVDYDRIVFSPAFRRLQNKTQVFPLPKSDFVRNRLTHSLETASIGRSLGNLVGEQLLVRYQALRENHSFQDFGALVSAACLAHDIGNPPFGHAGEDAISSYFRSTAATRYLAGLTDRQISDLQHFEGNAAGFRILTHTPASQSGVQGGLGLCYSTLATFVKYPKPSLPNLKQTGYQSLKKYNFFDTEVAAYDKIASELAISTKTLEGAEVYDRYPLAYLVEASDDICYTIIDFEDGYQMGLIPFEEIEAAYLTVIGEQHINTGRYTQLYGKDVKIAYLRSKSINALVEATAFAFIEQESSILGGTFRDSLLDHIPQSEIVRHIKKRSFDSIYSSENIVKIEAAGYQVLPGLLDILIPAVFSDKKGFSRKLKGLIPDAYLDADRQRFEDPYLNLLSITMFIASMTDQHAITLFRELNGISLSPLT